MELPTRLRLGEGRVVVVETIAYRPLPLDLSDVAYAYGPDSLLHPDVTPGSTMEFEVADSEAYPGTTRRIWVHTPAGHDPETPAALVVFQDGWWYLDPEGEVRGAVVLDNLNQHGAIRPTIGLFVDPGVFAGVGDPDAAKNRNAEYDAFDDRYATFLAVEVLPVVAGLCAISEDPRDRVVCGGSSGGNGSLTAAWMRPDLFGTVIAYLPSFAQIPGGNPYPDLLRTSPPRPLRVFMQAGHRDLNWDRHEDNWFATTLLVAAGLAESGYDLRLVVGDGGHSPNHGGVLLPDALRWALHDRSAIEGG